MAATSTLDRIGLRALHMAGFESRWVQTSSGPMHVLECQGGGSLPPLGLLHGFGASAEQLLPILLKLKKHVQRVVAPDLPGHGFSGRPDTLGVDALGRGVVETLDSVLPEGSALFGNSMGGAAAIKYALQRPTRVGRLILCSPGGAAMDEAALADFRKVFFVENHGAALEFVDKLLGRRSILRRLYAFTAKRRLSEPQLQHLIRSVVPADLLTPADLAGLAMPILMVWGQGDGILPHHSREFFRAHLPKHARIEEPERVGHSPYLEDPAFLADRILSFLRER